MHEAGLSTEQTIANGLLHGIEYFTGQDSLSVDALRQEIKQAALQSLAEEAMRFSKPGHLRKVELEKQCFIHYLDHLDITMIDTVAPLPYRRRLRKEEANAVRHELKVLWNFTGGYWNPLEEHSPKPTCFYLCEYLDGQDRQNLIDALYSLSGDTLFELTEYHLDYEIATDEFYPDGCETVYTDRHHDWIVYISHEGTIAFGGETLLGKLETVLANRIQYKGKWR